MGIAPSIRMHEGTLDMRECDRAENHPRVETTPAIARLPFDEELISTRRKVLFGSLLAALPASLISGPALAIDSSQTQVTLPEQMQWKSWTGAPPMSGESATLHGGLDKPGPYAVLMKWYPGYMSAPHTYVTDRLCFVLSGTWWVNSGDNFDPDATVPVPAGGFVRRVAHTPHYDGVKKDGAAPALIAIFGIGRVGLKLIDPGKPVWRSV